jgi:hypothetical protein
MDGVRRDRGSLGESLRVARMLGHRRKDTVTHTDHSVMANGRFVSGDTHMANLGVAPVLRPARPTHWLRVERPFLQLYCKSVLFM